MKQLLGRILPASAVGRLRGWRIKRHVANFPARIVEHSYGGPTFKVRLADSLGEGWYDHDWAPLPEIEQLRGAALTRGSRVFDIGAHQGVVALMLAREVGPEGLVVAIEPNPHNAAAARKNQELNNMPQIAVVEAAVSDVAGPVIFNEGLDGQLDDGTGAGGRMKVTCTTLDELVLRFGVPDLVFVDVEGAECRVLAAGGKALAAGATFAIEAHVGTGLERLGGSVTKLLSFFPAGDFAVGVRAEGDTGFTPLASGQDIMRDRFFLLAIPKSRA